MKRRFVLSAVVGLAAMLLAVNATHAQSYFFGYYYPDERRFHTDQEATEESYDSSDTPSFLRFLTPLPPRTSMAASVAAPSPASIQVIVPNGQAKVWFENYATKSTGPSRIFVTPPIAAGASFKYHVIVAWKEAGLDLALERAVDVGSGQTAVLDFTEAANLLRTSSGIGVRPVSR